MSFEEYKKELVGPYIPLITPFKEDYKLDLEGLRENVRFLMNSGVKRGKGTFLVAGAGGEFPTLSLDERKEVLSAVAEEVRDKVPLIFGAQHTVLDKVIELCKHAEKEGAICVQLSPPYYWALSRGEVYRFYEDVAKNTEVGIMVYQGLATFEGSVGMDYKLMEMLTNIENIISAKYSSPSMYEYIKVVRAFSERLAIIDNQYWATGFGHMLGAKGFLSACGNFAPKRALKFWELLEKKLYDKALNMTLELEIPFYQWIMEVRARGIHGEGALLKPPMRLVGLHAGPVRPPYNLPLPQDLEDKLKEILLNGGLKVADT